MDYYKIIEWCKERRLNTVPTHMGRAERRRRYVNKDFARNVINITPEEVLAWAKKRGKK
jgi:hypothetical protein